MHCLLFWLGRTDVVGLSVKIAGIEVQADFASVEFGKSVMDSGSGISE